MAHEIFTSVEIKNYDEWVQSNFKLPESTLVEHAGRACFREIKSYLDLSEQKSILILAGGGGNGADGLVIARELASHYTYANTSHQIKVATIREPREERPLNKLLLSQLGAYGVQILAPNNFYLREVLSAIKEADLILDAYIGVGFVGELEGYVRDVLEMVNANRKPGSRLICIDLPSGVDSDVDFLPPQPYLGGRVDLTIVIQALKPVHVSPGVNDKMGLVRVVDIGMPYFKANKILLSPELIRSTFGRYKLSDLGYKGDRGHLFIVGGSEGMLGAPTLSSIAAFKVGVGKVSLSCPKMLIPLSPSTMTLPLEVKEGRYSYQSLEAIQSYSKGKVVVFGPGLGEGGDLPTLVPAYLRFLNESNIPVIIDADALNILSDSKEEIVFSENMILTPHKGEFLRLEKKYFSDTLLYKCKYDAVRRLSERIRCNIVLKGPKTLVFSLDEGAFYSPFQASSLSVAGSGDVLAGMIGGLVARGFSITEGAICAVYLHGLVGENLNPPHRSEGFSPEEIAESIHMSFSLLMGS